MEEALDTFSADKFDCDILANTHDSYMSQARLGQEMRAAKVMKFFIEQWMVSPIDGAKFQMKSEVQVGGNWSPAKESNPDGLKEIKL